MNIWVQMRFGLKIINSQGVICNGFSMIDVLLPCGKAVVDVAYNAISVVGVKPCDAIVVFEPSHLFLGVDTGILFQSFYGHRQFPCSVEDVEHFLVTYGVQGIFLPVGQESHGFVQESRVYHVVHSGVNACKKFFAWTF